MPNGTLMTVGLSMPPGFPAQAYEAVHQRVSEKAPNDPDLQEQWRGAWNGVAYRFLAASDASAVFTASVSTAGDAPEAPERYRQEAAIFAFFVNALSVLDSFGYAVHALGALAVPEAFSLATPDDRKNARLAAAAERYTTIAATASISSELGSVLSSSEFAEIRTARNVLAHRAAPGRDVHLSAGGGPPPPPTAWRLRTHDGVDIPLDSTTTDARLRWLSEALERLTRAADEFARARWP